MLTTLKDTKCLKLKDFCIDLKLLNIEGDNVHFFKTNPENPEQSKIKDCSFIVIDGLSIRKRTIRQVIANILSSVSEKTILAILNVKDFNEIENDEAVKTILDCWKGKV